MQQNDSTNENLEQSKAYPLLQKYGIADKALIEQLLTQFGEPYILATIEQCVPILRKGKIDNVSGYIIKAIKEGYFKDQIVDEQQKNEQQEVKNQLEEQRKVFDQQLQIKLTQLKEQYVTKELLQQILEEHKGDMFYEATQKKGLDLEKNGVLRVRVEGYLKRSFLEKGEYDFEVYQFQN